MSKPIKVRCHAPASGFRHNSFEDRRIYTAEPYVDDADYDSTDTGEIPGLFVISADQRPPGNAEATILVGQPCAYLRGVKGDYGHWEVVEEEAPKRPPCAPADGPELLYWVDPAQPFADRQMVRGSAAAAGYDLALPFSLDLDPERGIGAGPIMVHTGVVVAVPDGYVGLLLPRSSLGLRGLRLANTVGVIDSDYRGPIILALQADQPLSIEAGERIAQLVIVPHLTAQAQRVQSVEALPTTVRGEGGFGSTGR